MHDTDRFQVSLIELDVNGDTLELYARPYFLKLVLPGNIVEDGREHSQYDASTQLLNIKLPKENPGEIFQGLELLTTLMAPSAKPKATGGAAMVEVRWSAFAPVSPASRGVGKGQSPG